MRHCWQARKYVDLCQTDAHVRQVDERAFLPETQALERLETVERALHDLLHSETAPSQAWKRDCLLPLERFNSAALAVRDTAGTMTQEPRAAGELVIFWGHAIAGDGQQLVSQRDEDIWASASSQISEVNTKVGSGSYWN